jgi:predicted acyltransferase
MVNRIQYLDSFRGLTIFAMILSGSIAFGGCLPAWMYHAQVPPPLHQFNDNIAGLTWVDLVFPFFLFSMGVAIPLSLNNKLEAQASRSIIIGLLLRTLLLICFAIIVQQVKVLTVTQATPKTAMYILFIFVACVFIYADSKITIGRKIPKLWSLVLALLLVAGMRYLPQTALLGDFKPPLAVDIIIVVLANVSLTASLFWIFCRNDNKKFWIGYLVLLCFFCLGKATTGFFNEWYNYSPFPLFFKWDFHKYLLIVLPGVFIGKLLLQPIRQQSTSINLVTPLLILVFVAAVLYGLFTRNMVMVWLVAILFFAGMYLLELKKEQFGSTNFRLLAIAFIFCFAGLAIEGTQGGIKKDSATFSYLLLTPGLAIVVLYAFSGWQQQAEKTGIAAIILRATINFLAAVGSNALGAYEMGKFVVWPLLVLTQTKIYYDTANGHVAACFLRGFCFTLAACCLAYLFKKARLVWKA